MQLLNTRQPSRPRSPFARMSGFPPAPTSGLPADLDSHLPLAPYREEPFQEYEAMFSKTSDPTSAPVPSGGKSGSNANRSVLGNDLKITGEIVSSGSIEILGEIDGNITADQLTVGADGRVSGSIRANVVEVKGRVEGKVDCDNFLMRAAAMVTADVTYATLAIESGATIEGRFVKVKV